MYRLLETVRRRQRLTLTPSRRNLTSTVPRWVATSPSSSGAGCCAGSTCGALCCRAAIPLFSLGIRHIFGLLSPAFFACGVRVMFIAVQLPACRAEGGPGAGTATTVLALIGCFNVADSRYAGPRGVRHLSIPGGVVFFAHQLGSFARGWGGGPFCDRTESNDMA